jgi:flagellar hook-associated protein 1 FlgK
MSDVYSIGVSALSAAQAGLVTTGHNISNANTSGYHRQQIVQSAVTPLLTGSGFLGQGVQVDTVRRAYSQFLDQQVAQSQAQSSYYSTYQSQLSQIDNLLGSGSSGVSPALQNFFQAVNGVAANPADVPTRQSAISSAAALVAQFNSMAAQFNSLGDGVNTQITSTVAQINSLARQISAINGQILSAQQNPNQPPNDLLDQRDALVGQLNQFVASSVVNNSDGTINVSIGNGQSLVTGRQVMTLVAAASPDNPQNLAVGYAAGGTTAFLNPNDLQGGSLGAQLAFRANDLQPAQNALGRVALGLARTFNDQQQLGQGLNGVAGTAFFNTPAPTVIANANNSGTAAVSASVSSVGALTTSDYRLAYSGANYTLTRLSDNTTTTYATLPQTVDGVTISISAGAAAGDSFLIQPTRAAAGQLAMNIADPALIAAAAPISTGAAGGNTGSAAISAGSVNAPPPANVNLQQPVTITFHTPQDGMYDVTGTGAGLPASNQVYTAGANISFNGWTVKLTGTPGAGDVFTVGPNIGGVADGRNALLLAGLQTQNTGSLPARSATRHSRSASRRRRRLRCSARRPRPSSRCQGSISTRRRPTCCAISRPTRPPAK